MTTYRIEEQKARKVAAAEKEAAKAARKAGKEAAKAAALGLTVEEYANRKKLIAEACCYENEVAKMEAEIKTLLREIYWRECKAAEIRAEIGE